jgi:hypothetical protein
MSEGGISASVTAARTRSEKPCQSPAMKNGRCRMHGGPSPGVPKGKQHAYKHGRYSVVGVAILSRALRCGDG